MRIAILVWGSLYWDPSGLEIEDKWHYDGPSLPIEFARISKGPRLTLVIKHGFKDVQTLYAVSRFGNFTQARENLRIREKTENMNNIGYVNLQDGTQNVAPRNHFIIDVIKEWNENKKFDAVLWSDFSPSFKDKIHKQFTLKNVIHFIETLSESEKKGALEYIRNAPAQINTRFRSSIEEHFDKTQY